MLSWEVRCRFEVMHFADRDSVRLTRSLSHERRLNALLGGSVFFDKIVEPCSEDQRVTRGLLSTSGTLPFAEPPLTAYGQIESSCAKCALLRLVSLCLLSEEASKLHLREVLCF